eukprot:365089-Chlamydomonas_euryale.AAC.12
MGRGQQPPSGQVRFRVTGSGLMRGMPVLSAARQRGSNSGLCAVTKGMFSGQACRQTHHSDPSRGYAGPSQSQTDREQVHKGYACVTAQQDRGDQAASWALSQSAHVRWPHSQMDFLQAFASLAGCQLAATGRHAGRSDLCLTRFQHAGLQHEPNWENTAVFF